MKRWASVSGQSSLQPYRSIVSHKCGKKNKRRSVKENRACVKSRPEFNYTFIHKREDWFTEPH